MSEPGTKQTQVEPQVTVFSCCTLVYVTYFKIVYFTFIDSGSAPQPTSENVLVKI